MKALITGGAGFLGSHLAEALLLRGHRVTILDDLSTGGRENIEAFVGRDDVRFVKGTVLEERIVRSLVDDADVTFHLAAVAPHRVGDHPLRSLHVNLRGTEAVLEAGCRAGRKVLLASTGHVSGRDAARPSREEDDLLLGHGGTGHGGYACAKALGECLALAYHREKAVPAIVVRLFGVRGPRQGEGSGRAVPRFVRQAILGEPITVHGDGKQVRSFIDVSDAVAALLDLIEHPGAIGEVVNVGSGEEITIEALAHKIKAMVDSPSTIIYLPSEPASCNAPDPARYRVPDIGKIQALTGFTPKVSMDEMLRRIIAHTAARLGGPRAPLPGRMVPRSSGG